MKNNPQLHKRTNKYKLTISINRLLGEFIGTLEGICAWEIPEELKVKLQDKVKELRKTEIY